MDKDYCRFLLQLRCCGTISQKSGARLGDRPSGNCGITGKQSREHKGLLSSCDDPEDMASVIQDGIGESHPAAVLVNPSERDFGIMNLTNGVTRNEGSRVPVRP